MIDVVAALCFCFVGISFGALFGYIYYDSKLNRLKEKQLLAIDDARHDAVKRSRSVIEGQVAERLVFHLGKISFLPSEARFLGSPVDYVVFSGMSEDEPTEIIFMEIKTGGSKRTKLQNKLRKLVDSGCVRWETVVLDNSSPDCYN